MLLELLASELSHALLGLSSASLCILFDLDHIRDVMSLRFIFLLKQL